MSDQTDTPPPAKFAFGQKLPLAGGMSETPIIVTSNEAVASVIFDNLRAELNSPEAPLSTLSVAAFEVEAINPVNEAFLGYTVDLRAACIKSAGSRATLVIQAGGAVYTKELPYGSEFTGDFSAQFFSYEPRAVRDPEFADPALPPLTIIATLSVQRLDAVNDSILLAVDSIHVGAIRG